MPEFKHGESQGSITPEYSTWKTIKARCYNENNQHYSQYGGRGISMCDKWKTSYVNFLADMGRRPSNCSSIDRIDVNGNYEPGNCRWATQQQQVDNTRRVIRVEYKGESMTLKKYCGILGIPYARSTWRYRNGFSIEDITNVPNGKAIRSSL